MKRTSKRSRSGAHEACPRCGKKLRGAKGLAMHLAEAHGAKGGEEPPAAPAARHPQAEGREGRI